MDINYLLENYRYIDWSYSPNKTLMPINYLSMDDIDEFNKIYKFVKTHYNMVEPTSSGAMPYNLQVKHVQRYMVVESCSGFELVICTLKGMFRFILRNGKVKYDNTVSGSRALKTIYDTAKSFGVYDELCKLAVEKEEGLKIKSEIESYIIQAVDVSYLGKEFTNCHHIDFNSSFASRICEKYPVFKPMYSWIYSKRKEDNGYFKHVLTNSIGMMQSKHCTDIFTGFKTAPYQMALLAKTAINGNNDKVRELLFKLELSGRIPLLINTDGIWYQGDLYHDRDEGTLLGQWKHDHKNCTLYIKTQGAYQFIEDDKVHTVLRGFSNLDWIKPREEWGWREIDNLEGLCSYKFDIEKGVYKTWVDVI